MKTKNAPKDLKRKINHTFFFGNRGSQKGGVRHLGKIPKKSRFFFLGASLTLGRSLDILLQHCDRFRKISLFLFKYGVRLFSTRLMSKRPAPTECSCFQPLSTCFSTLTSHFEPDEGQSKLILSWPNQGSWRVKMVTSVSLRSA